MAEYTREIHARIDIFEDRMTVQLCEIQIPSLSGFRKEIATLHTEI